MGLVPFDKIISGQHKVVHPDPLAGFKGSYFYGKGREQKGKGGGDKGERERRLGARKPSITNFWLHY